MQKIIVLFFILLSALHANENLLKFYKTTLANLQYDMKQTSFVKTKEHAQKALSWQRYANFSLDAAYARTDAAQLANPFETKYLSLSDTIDLFGKQRYEFESITLQFQEQRVLLNKQKEELFISLVSMISIYQQTKELLSLHTKLLQKQKKLLEKLLNLPNVISKMDILRLQNSVTLLQTQVTSEHNEMDNMALQLENYSNNTQIPQISEQKNKYDKAAFIAADTNVKLNDIASRRILNEARGVKESFLPTLGAAASYQSINDPTANGNNYSFSLSLNMPIDTSVYEQNEAMRAQSLVLKSDGVTLALKRKNDYIQRIKKIQSAKEQLQLLESNLKNYIKSAQTIEEAFMKRYVDFNTYIQTFSQTVSIQESIIKLKNEKNKELVILNAISQGVIYE